MLRAVALIAALLGASTAAALDPATSWHTLTTPHTRVHYPAGLYEQALAVARAAEQALRELSDRLGWVPDGAVEIVYSDEQDFAQGFAMNVPYNLVVLNAASPEEVSDLSSFHDWTFHLVAHELAHIVHIDTVRGLPAFINAVFGRILVPNGAQPRWFIEGLATYFESALTGRGRVVSPYSDMVLRMAVLEGKTPRLDQLSGLTWEWPGGSLPYLFGGRFVDYIVRRFGEEALRDISHDYGARLLPWAMNVSLERATGQTYPVLWSDFLWSLERRFAETRNAVDIGGRNEGAQLTTRGHHTGPARVAADGTLYFTSAMPGRHAELVARAPGGAERSVGRVQGSAAFALEPGGAHAVVAQLESFETYRLHGDLFRIDLETGAEDRLTNGLRARDVDVAPDGSRVLFTQLHGVRSVVAVAPLGPDGVGEPTVVFDPGGQSWAPRFSPDGRRCVVAAARGGNRDIFLVDLETKAVTPLTSDAATDGGPVFSRDGAWVWFHSDRDGVFNVYGIPAAGGSARRVTRVLGGAFHPEPVDGGLVYRTYGSSGFDLATIEIGPPESLSEADPPRPPDAPTALATPPSRDSLALYPSAPYAPLATLRPRGWAPILGVDTRGGTFGASIGGSDAVGRHAYALAAWYGPSSRFAGFSASYRNATFRPGAQVDVARLLGYAAFPYRRNGRDSSVEEEIWIGRLSSSWPLLRRRDWFAAVSGSFEIMKREAVQPLRFAPDDQAPIFPDQGRFAAVELRLALSNARGYGGSISAEEGGRFDMSLRLEDPLLGSEYRSMAATVSHAHYVENPLVERHVLAARLTFGYGRSDYRQRSLFAVGGLPARDIVLDVLSGLFGHAGGLRGFPLAPYAGDAIATGTLEYRLPLYDIESGWSTLPLYAQTLHAALFVDSAAVADRPEHLPRRPLASAGAELRLSFVLGDAIPVQLRAGFGVGLTDPVSAWYLVMGQTF